MTSTRRSAAVLVTIAVTAAVLTTAFAGVAAARETGSDDLARVQKSGDELAKSRSARFRGTTTTGGGSGGKVTFDGSVDFENHAAEYSVDVASIGLQGRGKVKVLLVGGVMYLSLDALGGSDVSNPALAGKKWLKLDPQMFGGGGEIGQSDPKGSLDALRGVKGDVKRVGSEKVRGTRATRYRATVDAQQAIDNAPEDQRAEVRNSVGALGSSTIPVDVWIDGKGRLRKVRLRVAASASTTKGTVAFEFFDLGSEVHVQEPPASEAVDFLEVLGETPTTGGSG